VEHTARVPADLRPPVRRSKRLLALRSDARLVELARGGDAAAFEVLYERYVAAVLGFCRHMLGSQEEAEDAVQQAFVAAHGAIRRGSRDIAFKPWLYTIARNRCLSMLRARREPPAELADVSTAGLNEQVERRVDLRELVQDVQRLPEQQRAALLLSELEDLSHAEVAEVIGCRPQAVKGLVFRARSGLADRRAARVADCEEIRVELAVAKGGALRRSRLRYHLESCPGCVAYLEELRRQRRLLGIALPVVPTLALKDGVMGKAGIAAGSTGAAGAATSGGGAGMVAASGAGATGAAGGAAAGGALLGGAGVKLAVAGAILAGGAGIATEAALEKGERPRAKAPAAVEGAPRTDQPPAGVDGASRGEPATRALERRRGARGAERRALGQRRAKERSGGRAAAGERADRARGGGRRLGAGRGGRDSAGTAGGKRREARARRRAQAQPGARSPRTASGRTGRGEGRSGAGPGGASAPRVTDGKGSAGTRAPGSAPASPGQNSAPPALTNGPAERAQDPPESSP